MNRKDRTMSKQQKYTTETFQSYIEAQLGQEYVIASEYVNYRTSIRMKHLVCGNEYDVQPRRVAMKRRCPHCYANNKKDTAWYQEKVREQVGDEYEVTGEYMNNKTHIFMKHVSCGHHFTVRPAHFLDGRRCPKCRMSKGETLVGKVLEHFKLHYQPQQTFKDCTHVQRLPFDFGIYTPDGELIALIEFDGEQHYRPVKAFGGEEDYQRRVRNDRIKNDFAKAKGIPLLRIPYFEKRPKKNMTNFLVDVLMDYHAQQNEFNRHS